MPLVFALSHGLPSYEIRKDMEHVLDRLQPRLDVTGETIFSGASRMALPIEKFRCVCVFLVSTCFACVLSVRSV